jgi:hypothetical protein
MNGLKPLAENLNLVPDRDKFECKVVIALSSLARKGSLGNLSGYEFSFMGLLLGQHQ